MTRVLSDTVVMQGCPCLLLELLSAAILAHLWSLLILASAMVSRC